MPFEQVELHFQLLSTHGKISGHVFNTKHQNQPFLVGTNAIKPQFMMTDSDQLLEATTN